MHRHQILTGAANPSDYSFAAGSIESIHFVAYTAGYNIVILSGDFQRVQVLLSGNENNQCLLTCIDCTYELGKIVAGFGNQVCIYEPTFTSERSWHHQVNYRWSLKHTLTCSNEKITAVAWHPKGDQLIVVCESGLQVWFNQYDENEPRSNKVNFEIGGSDISGKLSTHVGSRSWKNVWSYKSASPIKHVTYSNDGTLFATASQNDRLVKIWYRNLDNSAIISFTSTYLPHPRAVTYISWRQTSQFFATGTVVNCLLTCCKDNICRIWCETVQQDESAIYINDPTMIRSQRKKQHECLDRSVQKLYKLRYNYFIPISNRPDLSSPTSYVDHQDPHTPASLISSNLIFTNDEDINNTNGQIITTLSSSSSSSTSSLVQNNSQSSIVLPTTNKYLRFHLATTINPSTDSLLASNIPTYKDYMFIVQWLNNKDLYNLFSIEQFLLDIQRKLKRPTISSINIDTDDTNSNDTQLDLTNINNKNSLTNTRNSLLDDSKFFLQIRNSLKKLIDEWKNSPDVVFSIHPTDGSLLLWVIDWLDQPLTKFSSSSTASSSSSLMKYQMLHRQVQVSFSARIPDIFPLGDALSLQPHLIIYCNQLLFDQYLTLNQTKQKQHLPIINMITKHTNGTLNLWSLTFHEEQKFQSLTCVTHTARMCGHHFPIRHIVCHPTVPLVLTSSYYDENNELNYGKKQRYDNSLILWSSEPIGPLTMTGGITELARIESINNGAFKLIAWFPLVMPCMNINLLRESPSLLFCASDGKHLRVYQVVCNAKALLTSQIATSKSYQVLGDFESNTMRSSPSMDLNGPRLNVVSNQSTARPSCVLSLAEISDSKCIWTHAELIHIFPANAIDDHSEQISTCKIYYLVLVEKSNKNNNQSCIHMWKIIINYPDDDHESISMNNFTNDNEWLVQVQSFKVCTYILPLHSDAELQSVDVAFGHLSSSTLCYSDSSSSSPYLLSTAHTDGIIRFWTCKHQSLNIYEWSEWCGITLDNQINSRLKISGQPLAISNAYCGRLAVAYYDKIIQIGIYECESTGGTSFNCETVIPINEIDNQTNILPVHFDWASIENGAHLLATSIDIHYVFIYSYTQLSQWTKLRTIELTSVNQNVFLCSNLSLKWVRGGLLLIGINSELQVYSQWSSLKRQGHSVKSEPLIKPKRRINVSNNLSKTSINGDSNITNIYNNNLDRPSTWLTLESIDELSLFHAARNAAPVLPQYHPTLLLELVRFGKYRRVKAILAHLTRCIVSNVHSVEGKVEMKLMRSRTFSIANSDTNEPSIAEVDHVKYVEIDAIPLLPLFALFDADHENIPNNDHVNTKDNNNNQDEDVNDRDKYEDLFTTSSSMEANRDVEFKFDEDHVNDAERKKQVELNKFRRELLSNRNWSPTFDSRMVDLLVDYFQRVRLTNLTSLEQMYLLALADTLANASNDSLSNQTYSGEKPTNTMDDCGLRFLIDVQRYIYLSRMVSLPNIQGNSPLKHIITSASYAWAFHSDLQEDLLGMLPSMIKNKPIWSELQLFGVGWWIRNKSLITKLFEKLGKAAFELNNNPLDSALYFLALKKKSLVYNLYKHVQDAKMQDFFKNDFTQERWLKAAQKNAFALLGKQRFEHAAAFFLLAGKIRDAIEVILNNLNDIQLALLVARLYENDEQNLVNNILNKEILTKPHNDPFYRSMAYWLLKDYEHSLNTLLYNDIFEQQQTIFIFYDYLKQHPLVLRAKQLLHENLNENSKNFSVERRVHFQTAYYYLKTGCPLLALEILAKLPAYIILSNEIKSSIEITNDIKPKQTDIIDWSQPISNKNDDELQLEWSDNDDNDNENEEKKIEESITKQIIPTEDKSVKQQFDTIGQYMKLICCLKIIVEEMATLATGFEVAGGQLRHHLACWLEQEIGVIRQFCNLNTSISSDQDDPNNSLGNINEPLLSDINDDPMLPPNTFSSVDSPSTSSLIRTSNFETKMKRLLRRRQWLQSNEHLLRTLVSFTSLHGMHGGGLASVRMELLLLMHELYRDRRTQLKYPIPFPTQVPLLIANLSIALSVSNSAISYMKDLSQDLLRTMNTWLTLPKLTDKSVQIVAIRDLSIALASCVYQSLCHTNENQTNERIAVESFLKSYLYRRESVRLHRRKSVTALIERDAPTTAPKDWPGIKIFVNTPKDQENNLTKLRILLVEILISVYMSLLIYALSTDDCNTLYRLLVRKWSTPETAVKLWYGVFGGGAKKPKPNPTTSTFLSSSPDPSNEIPTSLSADRLPSRSSFASKIMIPNAQPQQQPQQPSYVEVFIPPRASIVNYFMAKVSSDRDPNSMIIDEDISEEDVDDDDDDGDDDDDISNSIKIDNELTSKKKERKIREREHTDSMSYSWVLMRYTIVRLIYKRLWAFFPHIGIEKHEIPSVSPLIQQLLQNLSIWQDSLRRTLETFNVPSDNYLPFSGLNSVDEQTTGLAIHRYRTILDPKNTPFSKSISALPAKRLWTYLVNDEQSQGIFIKYIFKRKATTPISQPMNKIIDKSTSFVPVKKPPVKRSVSFQSITSDSRANIESLQDSTSTTTPQSNSKLIYRDSEPIHSFCLNSTNPTLLAAGLSREIIELDISSITSTNEPYELSDDENELSPSLLPQASAMLNRDSVANRITSLRMPTMAVYAPNMYLAQSNVVNTNGSTSNTDNQHVLVNRHAIRESRKFANHPILPNYLTGCADGSIYLLNWSHDSTPRQVREANKRVTKIELNNEGNKFGVTDIEGNLSLHVLSSTRSTVYMRLLTHTKSANDFVFLDSSTLLATCGLSNDQQNVAIWDTLMPTSRANITSFSCHDTTGGGQCLAYSQSHQLLISGGKRGDICIFDLRQRKRLATSQAHDSHLKALCLDPLEKFYVTGSTEGNIKIWRLHGCEMVHCFYGEHSRRGFLHSQISGVNHLHLTTSRHLFSSGADGTISVRQLTLFD
ncbi:unnamed protein product [Rotaria sordida]|uniref:RAVE complex protein Rav1 C-terminal domain-containing protein n=1 Tax=Rotaria sordida TaxID=392033 RepID=A0A813NGE5_9BILA|nr:unnamed protein product [Rotaria sordida]CAF0816380.1 unnamed protein product [Rotaria sordida]